MNNVTRLFNETHSAERFAQGYLAYLCNLLNRLDSKTIAAFIEELEEAHKNQNTVFIIGNGGSAATASHMANDIGMDVLKKSGSEQPIRVLALTDNVSLMTAIANDDGYQNLFVNQLRIHFRPGDILVAISASGNSLNVIAAVEWAKAHSAKVIGLVGFDGGKLKDLCDLTILVETPKGEYGPVEDIHVILDHLIANWLQHKLHKEFDASQNSARRLAHD